MQGRIKANLLCAPSLPIIHRLFLLVLQYNNISKGFFLLLFCFLMNLFCYKYKCDWAPRLSTKFSCEVKSTVFSWVKHFISLSSFAFSCACMCVCLDFVRLYSAPHLCWQGPGQTGAAATPRCEAVVGFGKAWQNITFFLACVRFHFLFCRGYHWNPLSFRDTTQVYACSGHKSVGVTTANIWHYGILTLWGSEASKEDMNNILV